MDIVLHKGNKWQWNDKHPLYFQHPNEMLTVTPYVRTVRSNLGVFTTELVVIGQTHDYKEIELDQSILDRNFSTGETLERYEAEPVIQQVQEYRSILRKLLFRYRHTSFTGFGIREGVSIFFGQERYLRAVS